MADLNNITLNRLRSYSSIFSSTYFFKLLEKNDYSFINSKIERYDLDKVGKEIHTYKDYIEYVFTEMKDRYRNEYFYKNTFISEFLIKKYGVKDTVAINEFRVGLSIADLVMFNGTSRAFEIKTELDSDKRLNGQLIDYSKIFKECYIITHETLTDKYLKLLDDSVGVLALVQKTKSVKLEEIRTAKENTEIDADVLIRSIRTSEYKSIVKEFYGQLPPMNSFTMFKTCKELISKIPSDQLHQLFINELKKRKSNTQIVKTFHNELRQLCFSMNIDAIQYQQLDYKLQEKINF